MAKSRKGSARLSPTVGTVKHILYSDFVKDVLDEYQSGLIEEAYGVVLVHLGRDGGVMTVVGGGIGEIAALGILRKAEQQILEPKDDE